MLLLPPAPWAKAAGGAISTSAQIETVKSLIMALSCSTAANKRVLALVAGATLPFPRVCE